MSESAPAPATDPIKVDTLGNTHRPDGTFATQHEAGLIDAHADLIRGDMPDTGSVDPNLNGAAADGGVPADTAAEAAPADADAADATSAEAAEAAPVATGDASQNGDGDGGGDGVTMANAPVVGAISEGGLAWSGGSLWGGESAGKRWGRRLKKPAKHVAKGARKAAGAAREHLKESPIQDGPFEETGPGPLQRFDERVTFPAKAKINGAASKAAAKAREHLRESPIQEGPVESYGPGPLDRFDEKFTFPAKAKIRSMMGTAASKLKELRDLPTKAYVKGQTKLAEVGEFYNDDEKGTQRRKITGAVLGALSLAGGSYLIAKGAPVSPNGASRHAAEAAQTPAPSPAEHGLLSGSGIPEQLRLPAGHQQIHEAAQAAAPGAVAGPPVPPELAKQLHAKELADQALAPAVGTGGTPATPDSLLTNPDPLGLQNYHEHVQAAAQTGTGGAAHIGEAAQTGGTGTAGTIHLKEGSNPWEVSQHQLQLQGVEHPTNAQIEAFDKKMAAMNPDEYSYSGTSSEHMPVGTELKVPQVAQR